MSIPSPPPSSPRTASIGGRLGLKKLRISNPEGEETDPLYVQHQLYPHAHSHVHIQSPNPHPLPPLPPQRGQSSPLASGSAWFDAPGGRERGRASIPSASPNGYGSLPSPAQGSTGHGGEGYFDGASNGGGSSSGLEAVGSYSNQTHYHSHQPGSFFPPPPRPSSSSSSSSSATSAMAAANHSFTPVSNSDSISPPSATNSQAYSTGYPSASPRSPVEHPFHPSSESSSSQYTSQRSSYYQQQPHLQQAPQQHQQAQQHQQQQHPRGSLPSSPPPRSPIAMVRGSGPTSPYKSSFSSPSKGQVGLGLVTNTGSGAENEGRRASGHVRIRSLERAPAIIRRSLLGHLVLFVTLDGSKYVTADVSQSLNGAAVREKIFTALEIRDDDHASFTLFRHQMGSAPYLSEGSTPLSNEGLLDYCQEDGQVQVKGILAVQTSLNDHQPGVPLVPPPSTAVSSTSSEQTRGERIRRGYRPSSESASSISDSQAMNVDSLSRLGANDGRGGGAAGGGGSGYQASVSETSVSDIEGILGGPSSLHRKPHARRPSALDGSRTSPVTSRRGGNGSASSLTSRSREATSPRTSLDSAGVEGAASNGATLTTSNLPSLLGRNGSITPTLAPSIPAPPPPPSARALGSPPDWTDAPRATSPSPYPERTSSRQHQHHSFHQPHQQHQSSQQQSQPQQPQQQHEQDRQREREWERERERERARDVEMEMSTQEALRLMEEEEKRLADLAALEWERRDREEEEERKRRQIQADHEAAMREQRREQELYEAQLQREASERQEQERLRQQIEQQETHLQALHQQQQLLQRSLQKHPNHQAHTIGSSRERERPSLPIDEFGEWGRTNSSTGASGTSVIGGGGPNARTFAAQGGGAAGGVSLAGRSRSAMESRSSVRPGYESGRTPPSRAEEISRSGSRLHPYPQHSVPPPNSRGQEQARAQMTRPSPPGHTYTQPQPLNQQPLRSDSSHGTSYAQQPQQHRDQPQQQRFQSQYPTVSDSRRPGDTYTSDPRRVFDSRQQQQQSLHHSSSAPQPYPHPPASPLSTTLPQPFSAFPHPNSSFVRQQRLPQEMYDQRRPSALTAPSRPIQTMRSNPNLRAAAIGGGGPNRAYPIYTNASSNSGNPGGESYQQQQQQPPPPQRQPPPGNPLSRPSTSSNYPPALTRQSSGGPPPPPPPPPVPQHSSSTYASNVPPPKYEPSAIPSTFSMSNPHGQSTANVTPYDPLPPSQHPSRTYSGYANDPGPSLSTERAGLALDAQRFPTEPNPPRRVNIDPRSNSPRPNSMYDSPEPSPRLQPPRRPSTHYEISPSSSPEPDTPNFLTPLTPQIRGSLVSMGAGYNQATPYPNLPVPPRPRSPLAERRGSVERITSNHQRFWTEGGAQRRESARGEATGRGDGRIQLSDGNRRGMSEYSTGRPPPPPPLQHASSAPSTTSPSADSPYDGMFEDGEEILIDAQFPPALRDSPVTQQEGFVPPPLTSSLSLPAGVGLILAQVREARTSPSDQDADDAFSGLMSGRLASGSDTDDDDEDRVLSDDESDSEDEGTNVLFVTKPQPKPKPASAPTVPPTSEAQPIEPNRPAPPPPRSTTVAGPTQAEVDAEDGSSTIRRGIELSAMLSGLSLSMSDSEATLLPDRSGDDSNSSTLQAHQRPSNRSLPPIITDPDTNSSTANSPSIQRRLDFHSTSSGEDLLGSAPFSSLDSSTTDELELRNLDNSKTPLSRRKTVFAQNADNQWAFRPPPEIVVKQLHKFFPKVNLEAEVIETPAGNTDAPPPVPSMPATVEAFTTADQSPTPSSITGAKLKNRKSIRRVVEDRQNYLGGPKDHAPLLKSPVGVYAAGSTGEGAEGSKASVKVLRRRSTRMWGSKVEEVRPGELKQDVVVPPLVKESAGEETNEPVTFKWVKGDLIGKGAYGRVYLGLNATTGEMLAVKQVEMPKTASDRANDRQVHTIAALKSEIQLLKDLDHPNVVQYLGCEESSDFISIFLEYVPGGSLGSVFRKYGKLEEGEVRWFSRQILEGLAYLHSLNILHRDLKGDNILVDPYTNGICKITDFGISKQATEAYSDDNGTMMQGSVYWMAPEIVHNQGRGYSAKVDVWSFGCVMLEMFCGQRPWEGLETLAIILKLGHGTQPPIPAGADLSPSAHDLLVNNAFAIKVEDRPSAAEALTHEFLQPDEDWNWGRDSLLAKKVVIAGAERGAGRRLRWGEEAGLV